MRTSSRAFLAALLAAGTVGVAAQDRPESILPPGFGDPAPRPTPTATAAPSPSDPPGAVVQQLPRSTAAPAPLPSGTPSGTPTATPSPIDPAILARYEMPPYARRSLVQVGASEEIGPDAFGRADGGFLQTLMRRTAAPLPSRWLSILLRRTLTARLDTPTRLNGADFAAERAWLLLRMGESVAARAVVQGVDNADYTPKLHQVAMNAMLATGDPAGLCPLAATGRRATGEAGWTLAQPMCAALAGDGARARALFRTARRGRSATGIDMLLAEKVIGAGGQGSVTIEWDGVDRLTAWRFGLAAATGAAIPDELYATAGRQANYWRALSPAVPLAERIAPAEAAAGQGVLSSAALVDLYGAVDADEESSSAASAAAQDLRQAYTERDAGTRLSALRQLWGGTPAWPRLVLTARAAARQRPRGEVAEVDALVASMLSSGLDRHAARWAAFAPAGGDAWAMIALSDPDRRGGLTLSDVQGYGGSDRKRRLFFAGMAGLGRLSAEDVESGAQALDVRIGNANSWSRALDRAAAAGEPGTVALLAAIGMQTPAWAGVPPEALYRIVAALRAVGLTGEARMIAAEAIARA